MDLLETNILLLLVSATLFLGYIGIVFYNRTRVPEMIWLLGFGFLLGPVLNRFDYGVLASLVPMMSVVALGFLMFDAGINVEMNTFMKIMYKSSVLGLAYFAISTVAVGYVLRFLMPGDFTLLQGMLFGTMIGGTSTFTTLEVVGNYEKVTSKLGDVKVFAMMESVITDAVSIVMAMTLIRMIMMPGALVQNALADILFVLTISTLIGFGIGLLWALILDQLRNRPFNYIMTIAAMFPTYILAEFLGGSGTGPLAALIFGLTLTNYRHLSERLGFERKVRFEKRRLREFHEEITFFIRSFFFAFIGLVASPSLDYALIGAGLVAALALIRLASVALTDIFVALSKEETTIMRLVFSNGLTSLVISQLPLIFDPQGLFFPDPAIYTNLCFPIVIGTVLFGALLGPYVAKKMLRQDTTKE